MTMMIRLVVALLATCIGLGASCGAVAQTAPEGNAHPRSQAAPHSDGAMTSPFGTGLGQDRPVLDARAKWEFARSLDLTPLRDLAVLHNGRVKILDTLARETVRSITGRRDFVDVLHDAERGGSMATARKAGYDPLFTYLDLMIDPGFYLDKPVLGIEYLPLRRAFFEAEFPKDEAAVGRGLRQVRIPPLLVRKHAEGIVAAHQAEPAYRDALSRLDDALMLWSNSSQNLQMIAPPSADKPWSHITTLPAEHPVRKAAAAMGDAWRAGDAGGVHAAAATLAAELPKINAPLYPSARRTLELTYNRANAFEWGYWAYFVSLVLLLLAFGTGRSWLAWAGAATLLAAILLHGFGFFARCVIAERFAIQNQFESMTGLSFFGAVVGVAIMLLKRQWLFGAAAAGVGFMVLLTATQTKIPGVNIEREAAILNTSVLLKYHVTTVLVSYALIALGFVVSLFYLGTHYLGKLTAGGVGGGGGSLAVSASAFRADGLGANRVKALADLDTAQMTVLQLAFWTLGVGILLGAWWADHSWGRWWAFDPKETWALITWIVYLIVIHLRVGGLRDKGLVTAWLSVAGFIVMLWTYFGVNLLLPGLHAYA
jgi:cytochrome c-type biogenesis protein CcsB